MNVKRRAFLQATAACAAVAALHPHMTFAQSQTLRFADAHTHIGMYRDTQNLREAMLKNGVLFAMRKIVGDGAVIRRVPGKGFQLIRQPGPGELFERYQATLNTLHAQHQKSKLLEVTSAAALQRALRADEPVVGIGVEGGDFLEGDVKRLEAARQAGVVHLQLVHYRVSELGDISTERPEHGGLTAFGKDIVRVCNQLGVLVDVAHGTPEVIEQTLGLSTKPLVYSHGHVSANKPHFTQGNTNARAIHRTQAQQIAKLGGVIGIWPLGNQYLTLRDYAVALMDAAEHLGAAHVAVGSDIPSLLQSPMPTYEAFPALEAILLERGVSAADTANMLGRNYLRVLGQALAS